MVVFRQQEVVNNNVILWAIFGYEMANGRFINFIAVRWLVLILAVMAEDSVESYNRTSESTKILKKIPRFCSW